MDTSLSSESATESGLRPAVDAFARELDTLENSLRAAGRPLKELAKAAAANDAPKAAAALQKLERLELPAEEVKARVRAFAAQAKQLLEEEDRKLKFYFARDLREAAGRAGIPFAVLTTDPPEFRLGHLTAAVDLARRSASIRYARLDLERVPAAATAVLEACRKHQSALERKDFSPERFFDQLLAAYQVRLHRLAQPHGTRVDLVDLLAELAFLMQGEKFLANPQRENFTPYGRVQLAYDLGRLRRAGRLAHRGLRLSLGSATGGSTRQKDRVLYLEDDRGTGQYYLSIHFTKTEGN